MKTVQLTDTHKEMLKGMQSLIGLFLIYGLFMILAPTFRGFNTFKTILTQSTILGAMAAGTTIVIIAGGLDLSIGSIMALVAVSVGGFLSAGMPVPLAILLGLGIGLFCGLLNGTIIQITGIPSFIGTLGMMKAYRGVAEIMASGKDMSAFPDSFGLIGSGYVIPILIMASCFGIVAFFLKKTKPGYNCFAIGGNTEVSRLAGIPITKYNILFYSMGGVFAAVGALIQSSRLDFVQSTWGNGMELNCIAAVIIGGTSMAGGIGGVGRTVIGVLIINTLNAGLSHLGVGSSWQRISIGLVIIAAVWFDTVQRKKEAKA
ncbi:MAG: ABC transporter permease [Spirochaetaceae bacterium]